VTIRTRLANKIHSISKKPIRCIHRVFLGIDTRKMAASVASILERKNLANGNEGIGTVGQEEREANVTQSSVAGLRDNSFEDSDDVWEEEDPFIAFAHV
jgi:hypothetical protein